MTGRVLRGTLAGMTLSDANVPVPGAATAGAGAHPTRRRRPWTDAEKTEYLALFAESGLPSATFCREMESPEATLWLWRRQAREATPATVAGDAIADTADGFAAVQVVDTMSARRSAPVAAGLTLTLRWPTGLQAHLTGLEAPLVETLVEPLVESLLRALPALATPGQ